ncbi:MFS transporter [Capnocytophaga catalasegens]|uniref:MFS transporter n=1 Tax=Capnocytophaga catalasegens TaxID=1004260 RepID=A0AAV5ATA7_9FLAO|nr:MFS transporter [Capnocytophaga catalasegens]GIZ14731.1 MFS transporter [Capnocytophaga catalasegens]GJM50579.1 MFS transporter [Capnocytophaga catalasegens]GJM53590.1 MFS transporter [Capnocytophaga catalasegens]
MKTAKVLPKGHSKLLNAWAFYDWANSVYSLTIVSAIFPVFYGALFKIAQTNQIQLFGYMFKSTAVITFVTALAFGVVAVLSPILSGIADYLGNKKSFMRFFCFLGGFSCIGLYWFSLENIYFGLSCYFFGVIGFWGSIVFYNSYLPDIAFAHQYDNLSAKGYIMGYIGSVILLIFNLIMIQNPTYFGFSSQGNDIVLQVMPISFLMVGIWWIGFAQYTFYYLPENKSGNKIKTNIIFNGYKELVSVQKKLFHNKLLRKYLVAFFVFSMGVQTVMLVAAYFGEQEIAWETQNKKAIGLIISILLIQLVAILGAKCTAILSEKYGNISTLIGINIVWTILCILAFWVTTPLQFYIMAGFVGIIMGGIQALGRSTYSKFLPETTDTTSFFSFYDVAEKIGIVIGMGIYGLIDQLTGSMRNSLIFLAMFFFVGVILLIFVYQEQRKQNNEISA